MFLNYVTLFVCGFCLMALEILGGRALAPYFGFSMHVWGAVISVFLAALSVGYAGGSRLAGLSSGGKGLFHLQMLAAAVLALYPLYGGTVCELVFRSGLGARWGALTASLVLFAIPCALLGAVPSYIASRLAQDKSGASRQIGDVFAVSTIGGIAGTIVVAFYVIEKVGTTTSIQLLGLTLAMCGALSMPPSKGYKISRPAR